VVAAGANWITCHATSQVSVVNARVSVRVVAASVELTEQAPTMSSAL
jgi:hypothetical protein